MNDVCIYVCVHIRTQTHVYIPPYFLYMYVHTQYSLFLSPNLNIKLLELIGLGKSHYKNNSLFISNF